MSTPPPSAASTSSTRTTMRPASTRSTLPGRFATTAEPESTATMRSMPVPTSGFSARSVGTAWRCMFEPISARFASSCSRNGMRAAATDTICFGDTSMYWTLSGVDIVNSLFTRTETSSLTKRLSVSSSALAWAMT